VNSYLQGFTLDKSPPLWSYPAMKLGFVKMVNLAVRMVDISPYNVPCQCRQCPVLDACVQCVMTVSRVGEPVSF
jgi:hypothetical protein